MVNATQETTVLGDGAKVGDLDPHFTDGQEKGKGFRNVSDHWIETGTMSFDQGLELLEKQQQVIQDFKESPLKDWRPVVDNDRFKLQHMPTSKCYEPTVNALSNMARLAGDAGYYTLKSLATDKVDKDGETVLFQRDYEDADALCHLVNHTLFRGDRIDQEKPRLFRTWKNGSLRAVLSTKYAIINNRWILDVVKTYLPSGRLSHWFGDADRIFGNVLIPDSIRQEADSAYGGMIHLGNSEIGTRRILTQPSIFRSICCNGCIWDESKGYCIDQVHLGEIDLEKLREEIRVCIHTQIPLITTGIELVLGARQKEFANSATVRQHLAETARTFKLTKRHMRGVISAYGEEAAILGKDVNTAFGLSNAVTRFGQHLDAEGQYQMDLVGGRIATLSDDDWKGLTTRAATLKEKVVDKTLGMAAN